MSLICVEAFIRTALETGPSTEIQSNYHDNPCIKSLGLSCLKLYLSTQTLTISMALNAHRRNIVQSYVNEYTST